RVLLRSGGRGPVMRTERLGPKSKKVARAPWHRVPAKGAAAGHPRGRSQTRPGARRKETSPPLAGNRRAGTPLLARAPDQNGTRRSRRRFAPPRLLEARRRAARSDAPFPYPTGRATQTRPLCLVHQLRSEQERHKITRLVTQGL